CQQYYDLLLTF
nr:immunoglobulin light chain junction region [Macaca mulatta]